MEYYESQIFESRKYSPVDGIKVLVVDSYPTRREMLSKMLLALGHEVVTATRTSDVLPILEGMVNKVNLVLLEAQLPIMELYKLTEKMREISYPLSLFLTANDIQLLASHKRVLCDGATLCCTNLDQVTDLRGMWLFSLGSEPSYGRPSSEASILNKCPRCQPYMNGGESFLKRERHTWTDDIINGPPNKIYRLMNVPQLREETFSSYLQNHPHSMKQETYDATLQKWNGCLCFSNTRSHQKGFIFLNKSGVPDNLKFFCNSMSQQNLWDLVGNNLQGVAAHTTSGFGAFMYNGNNGDASQDTSEVGDNIGATPLKEDSLLWSEYFGAAAFDYMRKELSPLSEHTIFGAKVDESLLGSKRTHQFTIWGAKFDESLLGSKGTHQFNDEETEIWMHKLGSGGSDVRKKL